MKQSLQLLAVLCCCAFLQGCLGMIVGNAVDVGIEVVKIPFKVGKAAVDVVTDDDDKKDNKK